MIPLLVAFCIVVLCQPQAFSIEYEPLSKEQAESRAISADTPENLIPKLLVDLVLTSLPETEKQLLNALQNCHTSHGKVVLTRTVALVQILRKKRTEADKTVSHDLSSGDNDRTDNLLDRATIKQIVGKTQESQRILQEALSSSPQKISKLPIASLLFGMADELRVRQQLIDAVDFMRGGIKLEEALLGSSEGSSWRKLAALFVEPQSLDTAKEYATKALLIDRERNDSNSVNEDETLLSFVNLELEKMKKKQKKKDMSSAKNPTKLDLKSEKGGLFSNSCVLRQPLIDW